MTTPSHNSRPTSAVRALPATSQSEPLGRRNATTRSVLLILLAAISLSAAWPAASSATTVQIGQLAPNDEVGAGFGCGSCTGIQTSAPSGASYTVPAGNWVLTSWSTRLGSGQGGTVNLLMVEPSGNNYTLRVHAAGVTTGQGVNTFAAQIPVEPGWILGLRTGLSPNTTLAFWGNDDDTYHQYNNAAVGTTAAPGNSFAVKRLNISATIESDNDNDNLGDDSQDADDDNDGTSDATDAFPLDAAEQSDNDGDGTGNNADTDDDNDGTADGPDNCALVANPDQQNSDGSGDGGDACDADDDNDLVADASDNCKNDANADQANTDGSGDGGDACDGDDDNDSVADTSDNCRAAANADQVDRDGNGVGTACDGTELAPGACANEQTGSDGADALTGSPLGDRLLGLGGDDKLAGGTGDDCLDGGRGKDKLSGGDGNDTLSGGSGADRLIGGAGRNGYAAGSGTDLINGANGTRETIDCGGGRDTATVDRRDRTRGCERVRVR